MAAGGGMGRLAAELILREEPFVDPAGFAPAVSGQWTRFRLSFKKGVRMPVPIKKVDRVRIYGR